MRLRRTHLARRECGARSRSRLVVVALPLPPPASALGAVVATECERLLEPCLCEPCFFARDGRVGSGVCARVPTANARRVSAATREREHFHLFIVFGLITTLTSKFISNKSFCLFCKQLNYCKAVVSDYCAYRRRPRGRCL